MRAEFSAAAIEDIARLTLTHRLPSDTNERIKRSVRALGRFSRLGTELEEAAGRVFGSSSGHGVG